MQENEVALLPIHFGIRVLTASGAATYGQE